MFSYVLYQRNGLTLFHLRVRASLDQPRFLRCPASLTLAIDSSNYRLLARAVRPRSRDRTLTWPVEIFASRARGSAMHVQRNGGRRRSPHNCSVGRRGYDITLYGCQSKALFCLGKVGRVRQGKGRGRERHRDKEAEREREREEFLRFSADSASRNRKSRACCKVDSESLMRPMALLSG